MNSKQKCMDNFAYDFTDIRSIEQDSRIKILIQLYH